MDQVVDAQLEQITQDPDTYVRMKNRDVLLLEESLNWSRRPTTVCLLPAPAGRRCGRERPRSRKHALSARARLTLERGQGRSLSVQRLKLTW
jgi:hypothetical protein